MRRVGTFLGTGIAYLGKTEIWIRVDKCPHCGARGQLAHYCTGKYLQFAGISLFSIGRARIEDECRVCRRRRILPYLEWQARRHKILNECCEALEERPQDAGVAVNFLEAVLQYSSPSDLRDEAQGLADHHADNGRIMALLGNAFSHFREWEQADAFFQAADDSRESELLRALHLLRRGWPAEAAPKLEPIFQEQLQAYRDALYLLVEAYQARGQMADSARVLERIVATWPSQAVEPEHKWYLARNRGRKPLVTLALRDQVPALPFFAQPAVYGTLTPLLVGYLVVTSWSAQNREIYLINGSDAPYDIEIRGTRRTLVPGKPEVLTISEGPIDYKILNSSLPSGRETVQTFWLTRAFQKRTFVLNPDGLAVLHTERNVYAKYPIGKFDDQFHLFFGRRLHELPDVDLPFEEFPTSITVSEGHLGFLFNNVTYLRRLDVLAEEPAVLLESLPSEKERLEYLEQGLRVLPSQEFIDSAERAFSPEVLLGAASKHLEAVPVETAWHMIYQDLAWSKRNLEAEYQQRLQRSPQDQELQFLLGRVSGRILREMASPFVLLQLAREALANGDFASAGRFAQSRAPALRGLYAYALLAQRRYQELLALPLNDSLRMQALLAAGQMQEAKRCAETVSPARVDTFALQLAYAQGHPSERTFEDGETQLAADLFAGKLDKVLARSEQFNYWLLHLSLFLMASQAGQKEAAARELTASIERLNSYPPFSPEFQAARLLRHPHLKALKLPLDFQEKRVLLAALCLLDPKNRPSYAALGRQLNFEKSFPYWTVRQVLER